MRRRAHAAVAAQLVAARRELRRGDPPRARGRLRAEGHGARAVPPHRHGRARGGGRHARHRGRAGRGRPPLQRARRAVHGALRPAAPRAVAPATASRWPTTPRSPRAAAARATAACSSTSPTSARSKILERLPRMHRQFIEYQMLDISRSTDGGRADRALHDGRHRGGSRTPTPPTWPGCSPRASAPPGCTGPTDWAATRSSRRSCTAATPARPRCAFAFSGDVALRPGRGHPRRRRRARRDGPARDRARPPAPAGAARPAVGALRGRARRSGPRRRPPAASRRSATPSTTSTCASAPRAGPTSRTRATCGPAWRWPRRRSSAPRPGGRPAAATTGPTTPRSTRLRPSTTTSSSTATAASPVGRARAADPRRPAALARRGRHLRLVRPPRRVSRRSGSGGTVGGAEPAERGALAMSDHLTEPVDRLPFGTPGEGPPLRHRALPSGRWASTGTAATRRCSS